MTKAHHRVGITPSKKSPWKSIQITVIAFKKASRRTVLVRRAHSTETYTTLKKKFWTHRKITIIAFKITARVRDKMKNIKRPEGIKLDRTSLGRPIQITMVKKKRKENNSITTNNNNNNKKENKNVPQPRRDSKLDSVSRQTKAGGSTASHTLVCHAYRFCFGATYVRTDSDVITKPLIICIDGLPFILTHGTPRGAPLMRFQT